MVALGLSALRALVKYQNLKVHPVAQLAVQMYVEGELFASAEASSAMGELESSKYLVPLSVIV